MLSPRPWARPPFVGIPMSMFVLVIMLASLCSSTFLFHDKVSGTKTHMLPLGDPSAK